MVDVVRLRSAVVHSPTHKYPRESRDDVADAVLHKKAFYFQQRSGKLDVRAIGRLDIRRIVSEVDIDALQQHLENITFSSLDEDDLRLYSDDCFIKLFQLAQLTMEYLLSVQDTLATSIEALAVKYEAVRRELEANKGELQRGAEQSRRLRREVRQKRRTISKYEQLLAVPPPPPADRSSNHFACVTCGKLFEDDIFLQQHVARKHGRATHTPAPAAVPDRLALFVQLTDGRCIEAVSAPSSTVSQLKASLGLAQLTAAARLVYRGAALPDSATLADCSLQQHSQLVLIDPDAAAAAAAQAKQSHKRDESEQSTTAVSTSDHVSALMSLVQQQMQWGAQREETRRAHELSAAEALELKLRELELALPRRIEGYVDGSLDDFKEALQVHIALHYKAA
jgi:Iguana/Dzip1-like DAZ-interacting protein N-terminal/Ubiquitin family